jgi:hypothetical protein
LGAPQTEESNKQVTKAADATGQSFRVESVNVNHTMKGYFKAQEDILNELEK